MTEARAEMGCEATRDPKLKELILKGEELVQSGKDPTSGRVGRVWRVVRVVRELRFGSYPFKQHFEDQMVSLSF